MKSAVLLDSINIMHQTSKPLAIIRQEQAAANASLFQQHKSMTHVSFLFSPFNLNVPPSLHFLSGQLDIFMNYMSGKMYPCDFQHT